MTANLSTAPVALFVGCESIEEVQVAAAAIADFRAGQYVAPVVKKVDATAALAGRIEKALHGAPMNDPKALVLKELLDGAPDAWVAYPKIQAAFTEAAMDPERAAAALRDLSWQMGAFLLPEDVVGFARKIEVLAERSRAGGVYRYRLTKAGRIAVTNFLAAQAD